MFSDGHLDTIGNALKDICDLCDPIQCRNFFKAAEYEVDQTRHAIDWNQFKLKPRSRPAAGASG
jgi:hypothetical protein